MQNAEKLSQVKFSRKFYIPEKTKKSTLAKPLTMRCNVQNTSLLYTHDANKNVTEVLYLATANGLAAHYEYSPFGELRDFSHLSTNPSPGDLIGWRDTRITEIDIRTFNPSDSPANITTTNFP